MIMLWGPGMHPVPSKAQRAESQDIILGGRVCLRYLEAKTRIDLHVAICITWEREITVIIEGRSKAMNVMSSRGA